MKTFKHTKSTNRSNQRTSQQVIQPGSKPIVDNRSSSLNQQKLSSPAIQKKDKTGLPGNLKSGIENLSGLSMDNVKVYYNSPKPSQLHAHAYAQGTDIHIAPGQEKHLAHEAWHVVQQKQGRVMPTMQMKGKVNINDDKNLEKEADVMGTKALSSQLLNSTAIKQTDPDNQLLKNEYANIQMKGTGKDPVVQLAKWKFSGGRWIRQDRDVNDEPEPFPEEAEEGDIFDDRTGRLISASSSAKAKADQKKRMSMLSFADEFEDDDEPGRFPMMPMPAFEPRSKAKASSSGGEKKRREVKEPPTPAFTPAAAAASIPSPPRITFPNVGDIAGHTEILKKLRSDLMQSVIDGQELGGYIFWNPATKMYSILEAERGRKATIDLDRPPRPPEGFILVANYHTHPDEEGHLPPSPEDISLSSARGIPSIVIAAGNKLFFSGPAVRREGGEHHHYPVPDPAGGYTESNKPQVRPGEGAKSLNQ